MREPQFFDVPAGTAATPCRASECRRTVYFITTARGAPMPIDCEVPGGIAPSKEEKGRGLAHFATCAAANRFRRPKGKGARRG